MPGVDSHRQPEAIGAGVLLALALSGTGAGRDPLAVRLLAPLGTISYSVYLLHGVVLRELVDHGLMPIPNVPGPLRWEAAMIVTLILTIPVAWLSHSYIEQPGRGLGARLSRRPKVRGGSEPLAVPS